MTDPRIESSEILLSPPHLGGDEIEFVKEAFDSNFIAPVGPMVDAFEKEVADYTGIPHCLAVTSGTAAMHLALRHIFEKSGYAMEGCGDQEKNKKRRKPHVLASTLTFIGSISPAVHLGADITFIDCDRETWNMDPVLLQQELEKMAADEKLPAAVIPTDLYGQCCNLPRIQSICSNYGIPVVADSAEAFGAKYWNNNAVGEQQHHTSDKVRHAGFDSTAAVFSFNGNKLITTSGGGVLASHDKELIDHARKLSTQAREEAPHYQHSEIGYNYRMSNIVAAIGRGQLKVVDERVEQAREIFDMYTEKLADIQAISFMPEAPYNRANRWLTPIIIDSDQTPANNTKLLNALQNDNIEARPIWKPMHLQPIFKNAQLVGGNVSESIFEHGLCLPTGTAMTEEDLDRVCNVIRKNIR